MKTWRHRNNKLELVKGLDNSLILAILTSLASTLVNVSFAQRSSWGSTSPDNLYFSQNRYYPVHTPPHSTQPPPHVNHPSTYSTYYNPSHQGRKIVESVQASVYPLHFYKDNQGSYKHQPTLYSNNQVHSTSTHPYQYSSYFYSPNKYQTPVKPQTQPFYTNAYFPPSGLWMPMSRPSPPKEYHHNQYRPQAPIQNHSSPLNIPGPVIPSQPPVHSPPLQNYAHLTSSGPVTSASTETYREALDLFSEVVQKLEKETGQGFGIHQRTPYYSGSPSLLSNEIYSTSLSPKLSEGGFPHHLDHIMGPDFLQRARKLYAKIIKEQDARLEKEHSGPVLHTHHNHNEFQSAPTSSYPSQINNNNFAHPHRPYTGGLSYLEGMIHGTTSYERPSPYARNFNVEPVPSGSSLVDTIKAIEVAVPSSHNNNNDGNGDELMLTSGSEHVEQVHHPESLHGSLLSSSPRPSHDFPINDEIHTSSDNFPRKEIPLNQNDFVEHPLPYEEYEGLIKDIAINHNYR